MAVHYELAALEAARLEGGDLDLIKASFIAGPEQCVDPPDSFRADTFASIGKLRAGIAAKELAGALESLGADAVTSATAWIRTRS